MGSFRAALVRLVVLVCCATALCSPTTARADIVLLDEYWFPEIQAAHVGATEINTEQLGGADHAKSGVVCVRLQNVAGAPNVRFGLTPALMLPEIPPEQTEVRLWYRTDGWDGTWNLQIRLYQDEPRIPEPLCALEASLDCGGPDGRVVADHEWRQARGTLRKGPDYDRFRQDLPLTSYVWLVPQGGWDTPHITLVDRVEAIVVDGPLAGKPAPEPARRVEPQPGRVSAGDRWVWLEGEDALETDVPQVGGALLPWSMEEQERLSNGAWLQHHALPGWTAKWGFEVTEPGDYAVWVRHIGYGVRWALDGGEWRAVAEGAGIVDEVPLRQQDIYELTVGWARLDAVNLTAGRHTLRATAPEEGEAGVGIDCWLLTRDQRPPAGAEKPGPVVRTEPARAREAP